MSRCRTSSWCLACASRCVAFPCSHQVPLTAWFCLCSKGGQEELGAHPALTTLLCSPRPPTPTTTVHAASTAPSMISQPPVSAHGERTRSRDAPGCPPSLLMPCPADGPELWSSVRFHDYSSSSKDQMAMVLSTSCPLHPRATLCWREVAAETAPCRDVPNSTASEEEQVKGHGLRVPQGTSSEGLFPWLGHLPDPRVP